MSNIANNLNSFLLHSFSPLDSLTGGYSDKFFVGLENAGKLLGRTVTLATMSAVVVAVTVVAFPALAAYFSSFAAASTTLSIAKAITLSALLFSTATLSLYLSEINEKADQKVLS